MLVLGRFLKNFTAEDAEKNENPNLKATSAIFLYRKKRNRTEVISLRVKETLQSKKQTVMTGIMKKLMIRAIRIYRTSRPLAEATTIRLPSYIKGGFYRFLGKRIFPARHFPFSKSS